MTFASIIPNLNAHFTHEPHWWPIHTPQRDYEVTIGMVLVQQTRWEVVEAAVLRLLAAGYTSFDALACGNPQVIGEICKPCAFYTRKGDALVRLASEVCAFESQMPGILALPRPEARATLLALPQIGRESADTILLYGGTVPLFIVDAYARRFLSRAGIYPNVNILTAPYDDVQRLVEADLALTDLHAARELHAMMVEICIHHCTANNPRCRQSGAARTFIDSRKCAAHCPPCLGCPVAKQCTFHNAIPLV
ncbi:MAG: DNA repair protein [Chloroflexales bacterium]|nr:DNA repair protein [Chloroflexales bacterium]